MNPGHNAPWVSLYVGRISPHVPDDVLMRCLECFGRNRWLRAKEDYSNSSSTSGALSNSLNNKAFGVVSFEHGASALKCQKMLTAVDWRNPVDSLRAMLADSQARALAAWKTARKAQRREQRMRQASLSLLMQQHMPQVHGVGKDAFRAMLSAGRTTAR